MEEIWVFCFEGNYEVSNEGNVRRATPGRKTFPGKELKRVLMGMGYYVVNPVRNGKNVYTYVHRLVINSFVGETPIGCEVNHIDGNKLNNKLSNLEFVSHKENMRHARRLGLINDRTRYDNSIIDNVRILAAGGSTHTQISVATGISRRHCGDIINNQSRTKR